MFVRLYVRQVVCSPDCMFARLYAGQVVCSLGCMLARLYVGQVVCLPSEAKETSKNDKSAASFLINATINSFI